MSENIINSEAVQTVIMTIDKDTKDILINWFQVDVPEGYTQNDLYYTTGLFKDDASIGSKQTEETFVRFSDIDLEGEHNFKANVQGFIHTPEGPVVCGDLQQGEIEVKDGLVTSVPRVEDVYADVSDEGELFIRWDEVELGQDVSYTVRIEGKGSKLDTTPKKDIVETLISMPQGETGIQQHKKYTIYVKAETCEGSGPESEGFEFTPGEEDEGQDPNFNKNADTVGDPINMATGTFSYQNIDLQISGNPDFVFQTFYFSQYAVKPRYNDDEDSPLLVLGKGWSHTYMTSLEEKKSKVTIYFGEGGESIYKKSFSPGQSWSGRFKKKGDYDGTVLFYNKKSKTYTLTKKDQTQYIFNEEGKMTEIISPVKNSILLEYQDDLLHKVIDNKSSNYFELEYNNGKLKSVTDNFARKIFYEIKSKNLVKYKDAMNKEREFAYYSKSLMKSVKDQNGDVFVYNKYNSDNKVIFQQDANAYKAKEDYGINIEYSTTWLPNWLKKKVITAKAKDNRGNLTTFKSDRKGNLLSKETSLSGKDINLCEYKYDGFNNKTRESIFEGDESKKSSANVIRYDYDGRLNLLRSYYETSGKEKLTIEKYIYNRLNQVTVHTDHLGNITKYKYKNNILLEEITYPLGLKETFKYKKGNIQGLIESYTDKTGNSFKITYDKDLIKTITDPYSNNTSIEEYEYGLQKKIKISDRKGVLLKTTINKYNKMGVKESESLQFGKQTENKAFKTSFKVDGLGQVTEEKNAVGNITKYEYDPNMNLVKTIFPKVDNLSSEELMVYDRNNNLIRVNKGEGCVEKYAYNALNKCIEKTDAGGGKYKYQSKMNFSTGAPHPVMNNTIFPLLKNNKAFSEQTLIDVFNRPIQIKDKNDQVTKFIYEEYKNQLKVTTIYPEAVSGDKSTQYNSRQTFDALGRMVSNVNEEGNETTFNYTNKKNSDKTYSNVVTETNPLGIKTISHFNSYNQKTFEKKGSLESLHTYDALGRLIKTEQKIDKNRSVKIYYNYLYDETTNSLKTEIIHQEKEGSKILSVSFFNGLGQLVTQKDALGNDTERTYNPKGELSGYKVKNGNELNYKYSKTGRIKNIIFSDKSYVEHKYDTNGNCTETIQCDSKGDIVSRQNRTFDAWSRLETLTDLKDNIIKYQYNPEDQVTKLTYPGLSGGKEIAVAYEFDNLQRMTKVRDWENRLTQYSYSPAGMLNKTIFPNGSIAENKFDKAQRLTGLKNYKDSRIISKCEMTLDENGNPKSSRILQPLAAVYKESATDTYKYNENNQLVSVNGENLSYDANGNPVSVPGVNNIKFNDLNLMTSYDDNEYTYDAQGLRASSKINSEIKHYITNPNAYNAPYLSMLNPFNNENLISGYELPEGITSLMPDPDSALNSPQSQPLDQVLQITDEKGLIEKRFVYGMGLIGEEDASGEYNICHFDERGSTLAVSNSRGEINGRFAYDTYGTLINHSGMFSSPFLYNGRQGTMTDTPNLYSMRSRFYQPGMMRFLQQDFLLGNPYNSKTLNRYAYAEGNPFGFTDPLGLERSNTASNNTNSNNDRIKWWEIFLISGGTILVIVGAKYLRKYYKKIKVLKKAIANLKTEANLAENLANLAKTEAGLANGQAEINSALNIAKNNYKQGAEFMKRTSTKEMLLESAQLKQRIALGIGGIGLAGIGTGLGFFLDRFLGKDNS